MLHVRTNLNFYKLTEIVIDKTHMGTWSSRLLLLYIFQIGQNAFSGGDNELITGHTNTQISDGFATIFACSSFPFHGFV